jgi:hypothetical protein
MVTALFLAIQQIKYSGSLPLTTTHRAFCASVIGLSGYTLELLMNAEMVIIKSMLELAHRVVRRVAFDFLICKFQHCRFLLSDFRHQPEECAGAGRQRRAAEHADRN